MLCAAEPYSFGAEGHCVCHLLGSIGICADAKRAEFVGPLHQFRVLLVGDALLRIERSIDEHLDNLRWRSRDFPGKDLASGSINRDVVSSTQSRAVCAQGTVLVIDLNPSRAAEDRKSVV